MKRTWIRIAAVVLAVVLVFGGTALASNRTENKTLTFRDIKIEINGQRITPKDATGKVVEPFIIDGTTYLPIRAVSEALGLNVAWDNATSTVYLAEGEINIPTPTPTPDNVTTGMKNALSSAKNYLSVMPFSYSGLIKQLEYEQYSHAEAVYAADNCGADWYKQAALSAANYLKLMSFSRQGLIDQLIYEGFTKEQAEYGVSQNGY